MGWDLPTRGHDVQRYLHQIEYGNYVDAQGHEQFAFCVVFDYGDYGAIDLADPRGLGVEPNARWRPRADPFSDYRAGFGIRTGRLCRHILVFHRFAQFMQEFGAPECLVRIAELEYDENPRLSLLREIASRPPAPAWQSLRGAAAAAAALRLLAVQAAGAGLRAAGRGLLVPAFDRRAARAAGSAARRGWLSAARPGRGRAAGAAVRSPWCQTYLAAGRRRRVSAPTIARSVPDRGPQAIPTTS